jgi:hypothetical protein
MAAIIFNLTPDSVDALRIAEGHGKETVPGGII